MLDDTLLFIITCRQVVGVVSASSGHASDARRVECRECVALNTVYSVSMVAVVCELGGSSLLNAVSYLMIWTGSASSRTVDV